MPTSPIAAPPAGWSPCSPQSASAAAPMLPVVGICELVCLVRHGERVALDKLTTK